MRLGDAIAAVETLDGAQTHRSWWVARPAVASVSRGDGRAVLTLSNGVEAPVSRTYAPKLREAGWY
jgi:DNA-binding LytR/AlgR family response regulator